MRLLLKNQHIVLTGASEGIGKALAEKFAAAEANLILVARNQDKLNLLAEELRKFGQSIVVMPCDLAKPEQVDQLVQSLKQIPRLDGIIHNAGIGLYGVSADIPETEIYQLFEINFFSIQKLNRELLPQLKQASQGRIVLISSVVSWRAIPRMAYYCASKAALNGYAESLRVELANTNIKVVNIYPGRTKTNFSINAYSSGWRPFPTEKIGISATQVADKILRAYLKGKRDEYVVFSNRLLIWLNFFSPKLVDWGLKKLFQRFAQSGKAK